MPSFQRQGTERPVRCTPPIQRSTPLSTTWSSCPSSTSRPASVRRRRVCRSTGAARRLGREQRRRSSHENRHPVVAPGVAEERPRLSGAGADERGTGSRRAFGDGAEDAPLGQRQPVARGRILAAEPLEGLGQKPQLGGRSAGDRIQAASGRASAARPRPASRARARPRSSSSPPPPAGGRAARSSARRGRRSARCPGARRCR